MDQNSNQEGPTQRVSASTALAALFSSSLTTEKNSGTPDASSNRVSRTVGVPRRLMVMAGAITPSARRWHATFSKDVHFDITKFLKQIQRGKLLNFQFFREVLCR